jgi:hypothetical protein
MMFARMVRKLAILLVALVVALGVWNYFRAIPAVAPTASLHTQDIEHVVLGDYSLDVELVTGSPLYPPGRLWDYAPEFPMIARHR